MTVEFVFPKENAPRKHHHADQPTRIQGRKAQRWSNLLWVLSVLGERMD